MINVLNTVNYVINKLFFYALFIYLYIDFFIYLINCLINSVRYLLDQLSALLVQCFLSCAVDDCGNVSA